MSKPSLKDRRRQEAREALYRASLRRDQIIDMLVRNTDRIKKLRRTLSRLNVVNPMNISDLPVSVAEGRMLDRAAGMVVDAMFSDDISDISGAR